jgi:hypothetical protein
VLLFVLVVEEAAETCSIETPARTGQIGEQVMEEHTVPFPVKNDDSPPVEAAEAAEELIESS